MKRDRCWRRYIEEKLVKKRLNLKRFKFRSYWRTSMDINGFTHQYKELKMYIGSSEQNMFKTYKTDSWTTKYKVKYSPNKSKSHYRDSNKFLEKREYNKRLFLEILKEYGIK
jgi:hypothetical protein